MSKPDDVKWYDIVRVEGGRVFFWNSFYPDILDSVTFETIGAIDELDAWIKGRVWLAEYRQRKERRHEQRTSKRPRRA